MIKQFEKPVVILTEGADDKELLDRLCVSIGREDIEVMGCGGYTGIAEQAKKAFPFATNSNVKSWCIIRDADENFSNTRDSVKESLKNLGEGKEKRKKFSSYIWPDNKSSGEMEDLLCSAVVWASGECVDQYVACHEKGIKKKLKKSTKSKFYIALASHPEEPAKSIRVAFEKGLLDINHKTFDPIKKFLRAL